jgi:nucleotide-binding universal stress UspA family protein
MRPITRILVPTDFSTGSRHALELACDLATRLGVQLLIMHAYALPAYPLPEGVVLATPQQAAEIVSKSSQALHRELEVARAHGIDADSILVEGDAFDSIMTVSKERDADLIVMGTHGRRGVAHALLGSIAEKLVRRAPCPVMTVRGNVRE